MRQLCRPEGICLKGDVPFLVPNGMNALVRARVAGQRDVSDTVPFKLERFWSNGVSHDLPALK